MDETDLGKLHELAGVVVDGGAAEVQDDETGIETLREVDGLKGVLEGAVTLAGVGGGELIAVGSGPGDLDGKRAKVVQARDGEAAFLETALDAFHEGEADAV